MRALVIFGTVAAMILAGCQPGGTPPVASNALADSADQVLFGANAILTDRGVMRADLLADTAYFFDEGTRVEMREVKVTFFNTTGTRSGVLTSREGTYLSRQGNMEARKDVVVNSVDGRRLTSSQLRYDQAADEIASDSAFVLTEPGRRLEGIGFRSDAAMHNVRCLASCGGSAGAVTLPEDGTTRPNPAATDTAARTPPPGSRPGTFRLPE